MSLSVIVSLTRRASHDPQATYSINISAELDVALLTQPKELHERIACLYAQANRSLEQQTRAPVQPATLPEPPTARGAKENAPPDRMSRQRAAEYIGVKPQTLALWAVTGRYGLPYTRVGRRVVYKRADLDAWLAVRTGTSTASIPTSA